MPSSKADVEKELLAKRIEEAKRLFIKSELKIEELQTALDAAAENLKHVKPALEDLKVP